MSHKPHTVFCLLLVLLTLTLSACKPSDPDSLDNTLSLVVMPYLSFAPLFVALEEGFFEEEGLAVETLTMTRSDMAVPALIEGLVDVMPVALMPSYFNIIQRGADMRIVAGKGFHDPGHCAYSGIMIRSSLLDSGEVQSVSDLAGHSAAIEPSSPSYFRYSKFLESGGLKLSDMRQVDVPMPTRIKAFADDSLDSTTASEPWVSVLSRNDDARLWVASTELLPGYQFGQILFGKRLLNDRPDLGRKFMVAYLRAVRKLNREGKTERYINALERQTGQDGELLRNACWPTIRDDGRVQVDSLEQYQAWALGQGLIDEEISGSSLVDDRFVEYANQELDRRRQASK